MRRGPTATLRPPSMDRRELLKLGAAAGVATLAPARVRPTSPVRPGPAASALLAVADSRYLDSLSFARGLQRAGAKMLPFGSDLARLWFDAIAPRLDGSVRGLAGLTLESDLFVLTRLAESAGAVTAYAGSHDWRRQQGSTHGLAGRVRLDGLADALNESKDHWAARLGEALVVASRQEGGEAEERRVALDSPVPGRGPRYYVSWLLRFPA
jgi:hypothetical protein